MYKLVVLSCLLAISSAQFIGYSPFLGAWGGNYRGPLSLAPGQPANILAADGRPLDTLDVNLDKSAHLTAKALEGSGVHLLKKRSAAAPILASPLAHYTIPAAPLTYAAPLAYTSHLHAYPHFHTSPHFHTL